MNGTGQSSSNDHAAEFSPAERVTRRVWLTFDDGPSARCTPAVLGILRHHEIKATFFVVGRMVVAAARVLDQIDMDGHAIGNHSFSHSDLRKLDEEQIRLEILRTEELIAKHTTPRKVFRPPYGLHDAKVDRIVSELDYEMIGWDVDPKNLGPPMPGWFWPRYGARVVRRRSSSCVLLHDIHTATVAQLDRFLRCLEAHGNIVFEPPLTLSANPSDSAR